MEEAIIDSALDLDLPPVDCSAQLGAQGEMIMERENPAGLRAGTQKSGPQTSHRPQNRTDRVEVLRQRVIAGSYHVDSTELAQCIWHNSTRFLETSPVIAETDPAAAEAR